jgi:GT2 family glycosyltransferase
MPMQSPPPITLCIVNYNGAAYIRSALQAALQQRHCFAEILLVDNASSDGGLSIVRAEFPAVRLVALDRNRGPGAARNAGFAAARHDLILFQDNDICMRADCAGLLLSALLERPRALLVAPRVLYQSDPSTIQYDSADCHFLGLMVLRNANQLARDIQPVSRTTTSLVTACFLIDRRRWQDREPFDEDFDFNLEDHDFGVRANLSGCKTWVEPRAVVLHGRGTQGLSYRIGGAVASRRMYYLIRNRWWVVGKSYSRRTLMLLLPILVVYEIAQLIGLSKNGWLPEWWQAVRCFCSHLPALRQKRLLTQSRRQLADRDLLCGGPLPFTAAMRTGAADRFAITWMGRTANLYWILVRRFI